MSLPTNFFIGRGGGPKVAPDFTSVTSSQVFYGNREGTYLLSTNASTFATSPTLASDTTYGAAGNFPAELADYVWSADKPDVHKYVLCGEIFGTNNFLVYNTDPNNYTLSNTYAHNYNIRAFMMLRNGIIITGDNNNNRVITWKMLANGDMQQLDAVTSATYFVNIESFANPDDSAGLGDTTLVHVCSNNYMTALHIAGDGNITTLHTQSVSNDIGACHARSGLGLIIVQDNDTAKSYNYTVAAGYSFNYEGQNSGNSTAAAIALDPFGYGYRGHWGREFHRLGSNLNRQDVLSNSNYIHQYPVSLIYIADGSSYGALYLGGYDAGNTLQTQVTRLAVTGGNSWGALSKTPQLGSSSGYGVGGTIVGQRPKYAEQDFVNTSFSW